MPRDLHQLQADATKDTMDEMGDLSAQPGTEKREHIERSAAMDVDVTSAQEERGQGKQEDEGPVGVKVYPKALNLSDVDACVVLEEAAFPENQRCSREKFIYRITTAPELCHGLFTTSSSDYEPHHLTDAETAKVAPLVESSSSRKQILIAHAVGTLSANETITDEDMLLPPAWMDGGAPEPDMLDEPLPIMGNQDLGGRVAMLHSLAVLPNYQGKRIGTTMLKGYIDLLRASGNYTRLALLADLSHIDFYEERGFQNLGKSEATFGGEEWYDMVMDFKPGDEGEIITRATRHTRVVKKRHSYTKKGKPVLEEKADTAEELT